MSEKEAPVTDPAKPGDNPDTEFRRARQLTRHSQADVAKALDVSRQTISRWESGERQPPQEILDWLFRNRNQYPSQPAPLTGLKEPRGQAARLERARALLPVTEAAAKAAEGAR